MQWRRWSLLAGLCVPAPVLFARSLPAGCPVVLAGEVHAGQQYRQPIGGGLVFEMEPGPSGWVVRVEPESGPRPPVDYAAAVTPPFRSVNPLLLTTDWGFRAQDVIGWSARNFHFVRNKAAFAAAARAYGAAVATRHPTPAQTAAVTEAVSHSAEGRLEILDARLLPGSGDPSPAAAMLGSRFASTAHTLVTTGGGGVSGRVEQLRFRATLGGSPARWGSKLCAEKHN